MTKLIRTSSCVVFKINNFYAFFGKIIIIINISVLLLILFVLSLLSFNIIIIKSQCYENNRVEMS